MGFSEKAKKYFYVELGLNNREISKKMDNYNEVLISRYLNSDNLSPTFIKKIKKYFPEANIGSLVSDNDMLNFVAEPSENYNIDPVKRIERIIKELSEIKDSLTQK